MKIKYRRFDDNDYTEVECDDFLFQTYPADKKLRLVCYFVGSDVENEYHTVIRNVCEVYIEEI